MKRYEYLKSMKKEHKNYCGIWFYIFHIIRFDVDSPEKLCFENKTKFGKK